jgi:hypothetical protein
MATDLLAYIERTGEIQNDDVATWPLTCLFRSNHWSSARRLSIGENPARLCALGAIILCPTVTARGARLEPRLRLSVRSRGFTNPSNHGSFAADEVR